MKRNIVKSKKMSKMEAITNMEVILKPEDQQNFDIPQLLFNYIKEKHGTAKSGLETSGILESIRFISAGFPYPTDKTYWTAHLELTTNKDNINPTAKTLVIGVHWPEEHCSWSRCVQVEASVHNPVCSDGEPYARCRWSIVENSLFEKHDRSIFTLEVAAGFSLLGREFLSQLSKVY